MPRISNLQLNTRAAAQDELPSVNVAENETQKLTVDMIMPTGSILDYAGAAAPAGWLLCYGQTLNATANPEYADLYAVIGNTYGGSSIADFVVPDLRGRVVAGQDDMGDTSANRLTGQSGGVDGDVLGGSGGAETHTLTTAQIPSHQHESPFASNAGGDSVANYVEVFGSGRTAAQTGQTIEAYNDTANSAAEGNEVHMLVSATGGGGAHNNVQPTIILNKIIKY